MPQQAAAAYRERSYSGRNGLRLYYRDYGDPLSPRTPIVCLAGLTRNSKDFRTLAGRLSANRRVICPDYRGRGRSAYDPDWRNYAPKVILNDVMQLLAANNLHRIIICGTSFGGLLAMALAVAAPTALAGVILNDVGPEVDGTGSERIMDYISRDLPQPDWDTATATMKATFPALSFTSEEDWRRFTEATFREGEDGQLHFDWDLALAKPLRDGAKSDDLWAWYRALRHVPVLAIRGGLSDVLSADTFALMAEAKPDLRQLTLPHVGHAPSLNEPESEKAIDDFIAAIEAE